VAVGWLLITEPGRIIGLNLGQYGHLHLGFAVHLQPERLVIGTRSLLLLLSRRAHAAAFKNQLAVTHHHRPLA